MKATSMLTILFFVTLMSCKNDNSLYQSDQFRVFSNKVEQENFVATALSSTEIQSNYLSIKPINRLIAIKFAINGQDNEAGWDQNHTFLIDTLQSTLVTPVYIFGNWSNNASTSDNYGFLTHNSSITFKLDMRPVFNEFKKNGYYQTWNKEKIYEKDFEGVYIAGSTSSLTWDLGGKVHDKQFKLLDENKDSIYEISINFIVTEDKNTILKTNTWKLTQDISKYPQYSSDQKIVDAIYNMSLEEMLLDIRPDSCFMAGKLWDGVWTRDISYSITLALAAIEPQISKNSLMRKVKKGKIIQDTGTGGSWPVSTDRVIWATAAWEIFLSTGDTAWLKQSYEIIKNSAIDDIAVALDKADGLFMGESSFLDWRNQTYPKWMDPKDIYKSKCLGTNVAHYNLYVILSEMAKQLHQPNETYLAIAKNIKTAINQKMWISEKNYYGQFIYGRDFESLSPKWEALGEALTIISGIADDQKSKLIIDNTPVQSFGVPTIYPHSSDINPYHNKSNWPFVQAYWNLAAKKVNNEKAVQFGLASIFRSAALFLSNKENFALPNGDFNLTAINSDRQLWSVAASLSSVYKILIGMNFTTEGLTFTPFVPKVYSGFRSLKNFKYRNAILDISLTGYGNKIKEVKIDGILSDKAFIAANTIGKRSIEIVLDDNFDKGAQFTIANHIETPITTTLSVKDTQLNWKKISTATKYKLFGNSKFITEVTDTFYIPEKGKSLIEYQVMAIDAKGIESFLSEPMYIINPLNEITIEVENGKYKNEKTVQGFSGRGYLIVDTKQNKNISFDVDVIEEGLYCLDVRYANGNGEVEQQNKCANRSLFIDEKEYSSIVMPQRGTDWSLWGFSNSQFVNLTKGKHLIRIEFKETNNNMNFDINEVHMDYIRLRKY